MTNQDDWNIALEEMKKTEAELSHSNSDKPKKSGKRLIIPLVIILIIVAVGVFWTLSGTPTVPDVIAGDPAQFDPQISLESVQKFAGDNVRLLSLEMTQVKPDGTVNVSASETPAIAYTFVTTDNTNIIVVNVASDLSMSKTARPISGDEQLPERVVPPTCPIDQLWQLAKTYDVPSNGVADIDYTVDGYRFMIDLLEIDLQFSGDCILIRS